MVLEEVRGLLSSACSHPHPNGPSLPLILHSISNPLLSLINSTCHDAAYISIPEAPDSLPRLVAAAGRQVGEPLLRLNAPPWKSHVRGSQQALLRWEDSGESLERKESWWRRAAGAGT